MIFTTKERKRNVDICSHGNTKSSCHKLHAAARIGYDTWNTILPAEIQERLPFRHQVLRAGDRTTGWAQPSEVSRQTGQSCNLTIASRCGSPIRGCIVSIHTSLLGLLATNYMRKKKERETSQNDDSSSKIDIVFSFI